MSEDRTRLAGLYSVIAAAVALVVSPVLALSYFETAEGMRELENATVSGWADPGRDLVGGLLTWASPDRVYGTYWLLFWVLFASVFFCARAVHAQRPPDVGPLERWGWGLALAGYALGAVGGVAACVVIVAGSGADAVIDVAFFAVMVPAMLIDVIGSTLLGIALMRRRYEPRVTAWLLVLVLPSMVVLPVVLGNLSLGLLVVLVAWAATGWRLWRTGTTAELAAAAAR